MEYWEMGEVGLAGLTGPTGAPIGVGGATRGVTRGLTSVGEGRGVEILQGRWNGRVMLDWNRLYNNK